MKRANIRKLVLAFSTTISILMGLILLPGIVLANSADQSTGTTTPTASTGSGSDSVAVIAIHIVQPFETLGRIAFAYRVTVVSILQANPSITNPSLIYAGEQMNIPAPNLGPDQNVWAGYSAYRATVEAGASATTQLTETAIPATPSPTTVATPVNTPTASTPTLTPTLPSMTATITASLTPTAAAQNQPTPSVTQTYVVKPANTLGVVANLFRVTVVSILESNLSITNPNLIFIGQELHIPASNLTPGQSIWSGYNFGAYPPVPRPRVVPPTAVRTATPIPITTSIAPTAQTSPSPTVSQPTQAATAQPTALPTEIPLPTATSLPPQPTSPGSNPYPVPGVPPTPIPGVPYPGP